jgi:putative inorganic carbon (HCO3(-)) transporter
VEDLLGRDQAQRGVLIVAALRRWFPWLQLGWLILLSPFLLFITIDRWWWLLGIPAIWLASWLIRGFPVQSTPLNVSAGLIAGMVILSLLITPDMTLTLPKAAGLFLGLAVLYAVVDISRLPRGITLVTGGLIVLGLGVSVLGLLGIQWLEKFGLLASITSNFPRVISGLPGAAEGFHPNEVAGALLWIIPLAAAVSLVLLRAPSKRHGVGIIAGLAAVWMLGVLLLSQSRSGWFGLAVALVILLAVASRRIRWIAAGLMVILIVIVIVVGPQRLGSSLFGAADRIAVDSNPRGSSVLNWNFRLEVWQAAVEGISDFPFTGMGIGTFRKTGRLFYPLSISPDYDFAHAHNELLQAGLDLGIPGLVALVAIYLGTFGMLWMLWKNSPELERRYLALGLAGSLLAHAIYGFTDAVALGAKPGFIFWILLGLTCGLFLHHRKLNSASLSALADKD